MATAFAGECTKDKCEKCEANTGAAIKYCTRCHGAAIFKTGTDRTCTGGTAITNCEKYEVSAGDKVGCVGCTTGFHLWVGATIDLNLCVACDLTTKFINTSGVCSTPTAVTGCATFANGADKCTACTTGKTITDKAVNPTCETSITNCNVIDNTAATKCKTPATGFHVKADGTIGTNITNCHDAAAGADGVRATDCATCKDGFWKAADAKSCAALTVANCNASTGTAAECTTCKTGFVAKTDKTACDALPTGCLTAAFDGTVLKCTMCSMAASYYASDVKGTATFGTPAGWEQVCTKTGAAATTTTTTGAAGSSAQIVAFGVILAMISNF